jgi:DNA-binding HxlR family transcriptional regulator
MATHARSRTVTVATAVAESPCCPYYHEAIELIGKRWTGVIVQVLISSEEPLRFSQIAASVPELSDRLLSERMKELEARGLIRRTVRQGPPVRVEYALTEMGEDLRSAVAAMQTWARRWLVQR